MVYFRNILLLFCLNACLNGLWGQVSTIPFPTEDIVWDIKLYCYDPQTGGMIFEQSVFPDGDTTINNNEYTIFGFPNSKQNFYRVEGAKVYFLYRNTPDSSEFLLFDFDINVGDTFIYDHYWLDPGFSVVESVEYITTLDGVSRKKINFDSSYTTSCGENYYWIEGLGSGPAFPFYCVYCFDCTHIIEKIYVNSQLVYSNQPLGITSLDSNPSLIDYYPNPVADYLSLSFPNDLSEVTYYIYSPGGPLLQYGWVEEKRINFTDLPSGFYYVKLVAKNLQQVLKVVKL